MPLHRHRCRRSRPSSPTPLHPPPSSSCMPSWATPSPRLVRRRPDNPRPRWHHPRLHVVHGRPSSPPVALLTRGRGLDTARSAHGPLMNYSRRPSPTPSPPFSPGIADAPPPTTVIADAAPSATVIVAAALARRRRRVPPLPPPSPPAAIVAPAITPTSSPLLPTCATPLLPLPPSLAPSRPFRRCRCSRALRPSHCRPRP